MAFVKVKLDKAYSGRGAEMGRQNYIPDGAKSGSPKLRLVRLRWVDGDYDSGGAYWGGGMGNSIYYAFGWDNPDSIDGEKIEIFVRASSRGEAKDSVRRKIPGTVFVRLKAIPK